MQLIWTKACIHKYIWKSYFSHCCPTWLIVDALVKSLAPSGQQICLDSKEHILPLVEVGSPEHTLLSREHKFSLASFSPLQQNWSSWAWSGYEPSQQSVSWLISSGGSNAWHYFNIGETEYSLCYFNQMEIYFRRLNPYHTYKNLVTLKQDQKTKRAVEKKEEAMERGKITWELQKKCP